MTIALLIAKLLAGLALLWKTGEWSVKNAVQFSVIYKIESFVIGFFLFAVSTGLPEITSAFVSSFKGVPELSAGDLIGSTFVNLSLLLGVSTIIAKTLPVDEALKNRIFKISLAIGAIMISLPFFPVANIYFGGALIIAYILSFFFMQKAARTEFVKEVVEIEHELEGKAWIASPKIDILLKLFTSLMLLVLSSWITVNAAVSIATIMNVPFAIIGGTIIAVGTSLPELTLEIHAIRRKEYALALGDIFGSSFVNMSFVLGFLIIFNPTLDLTIAKQIFPFLITVLIFIFYRGIFKGSFRIFDGILFILAFILYMLKLSWSMGTIF